MRVVGEASEFLSDQAPWKLRTSEPERFATVLHVAAQAVSDCRDVALPVLAAQCAGGTRGARRGRHDLADFPQIREVEDLDGGPGYPVLAGDYRRGVMLPAWGPAR